MTIYGLLCGLKDYVNIADFMKLKEEYFIKLLGLENGTSSCDYLSDLFASIDSQKFMKIFIEWTKDIIKKRSGKNISIDGKTIKSVTDNINNRNISYIVSVFIWEVDLSIGKIKVDYKSNEITTIPNLDTEYNHILVLYIDESSIKINGEQYYLHNISDVKHTLHITKHRSHDDVSLFMTIIKVTYNYETDNA